MTTETNSKALCIFPHQLFEVTLQKFHNGWNDFIAHVFVYKLCLQLCFLERWKKASQNLSFFKKELHIENECTSWKRTTFWKWTHILKKNYILKMFLEKCLVIWSRSTVDAKFVSRDLILRELITYNWYVKCWKI